MSTFTFGKAFFFLFFLSRALQVTLALIGKRGLNRIANDSIHLQQLVQF